jgi:lysophospholipase L1-like esterase
VINLSKDGATIDDIHNQATTMAGMGVPADSVVFVQAVDNDIRCDGTDADNYAPFGEKVAAVLKTIKEAAPKAQIYLLAQPVSVQNWTDVAATVPSARVPLTGDGVCDSLDAAGKQRPTAIAYQQDVVDHYHQQLATACSAVPGCVTNNAALQKLEIAPTDISSDGNHFTVQGHAKFAAAVWRIFFTS